MTEDIAEPLSLEHKNRLLRFNRAVEHLLETRFAKDFGGKKHGITYHFSYNNPDPRLADISIERRGHDFDDLIVATTIVRRFQDKGSDLISKGMLGAVYETAIIDEDLKKEFRKLMDIAKEFGKKKASFFLQEPLSYDYIFEHMVYGYILHENVGKTEIIERWRKDEVRWEELTAAFNKYMMVLAGVMKVVRDCNLKVLEKYG